MSDRKHLPGKFVWFEHVSRDARRAQGFFGEVLGWRVQPFMDSTYEMIYLGDTMIGGYATPRNDRQPPHWISSVSVENVDTAARAATASGGKIVEGPVDLPGVGRMARIADPQGAEICLFRNDGGDPADAEAPAGGWLWNELHTSEPTKALAFYDKVVGFAHRTVDMGHAGAYHILSRGGVDRGGVTHHLPGGVPPHWLPYVHVQDVDSTLARASKLGATLPMPAEDIPGIGRFGVLTDPTGAVLALMKPLPRGKQG